MLIFQNIGTFVSVIAVFSRVWWACECVLGVWCCWGQAEQETDRNMLTDLRPVLSSDQIFMAKRCCLWLQLHSSPVIGEYWDEDRFFHLLFLSFHPSFFLFLLPSFLHSLPLYFHSFSSSIFLLPSFFPSLSSTIRPSFHSSIFLPFSFHPYFLIYFPLSFTSQFIFFLLNNYPYFSSFPSSILPSFFPFLSVCAFFIAFLSL